MLTEPKVRRDKRCVVCKGERKFNFQRGVPHSAYLTDPFCSSVCARKFYGTEIANAAPPGPTARYRGKGIRITKAPKYT